mgnify:FL=1
MLIVIVAVHLKEDEGVWGWVTTPPNSRKIDDGTTGSRGGTRKSLTMGQRLLKGNAFITSHLVWDDICVCCSPSNSYGCNSCSLKLFEGNFITNVLHPFSND